MRMLLAVIAVLGLTTFAVADPNQTALSLLPMPPMPVPSAPPAPPPIAYAFKCRDFRNLTVRLVEVKQLGDVGRAEHIEGSGPVIMVDPEILSGLPPQLQLFFKLHECGHHVMGHLFAPTNKSEKEADCWAIQKGRERAAFTKEDLISWKPYFANSRGDDFGHMPGPQRVEYLLGCFDE